MLVPFVPPVISCFSSLFSLRKSPTLSAKINAILFLSLTTLTACGGSDSTEPTPTPPPKDTTAPVITLIGNTPLTHSIDTSYDDEGATANDATDGNVDVTMTGSVDSSIVNSYTLIYTATDAAGNTSTSTRIVNVIDDIAPVITLGGSSEVIHPVGTPYVDASANASDNVDEAINVITSDDVKADAIGSYTVTYTAKDEAGNEATAVMRTVNVVDLTAPVITLNGEAKINHEYGIAYKDAGATATDNIDSNVETTTTDTILINKIGSYGITYTARDAAGNEAIPVERIVTVVDTIGPVITLNGSDTIILGQGRDYKELGATARDNADGDITVEAPAGEVINTVIDSYVLTYTATDLSGNTTTLNRTINVVAPRPFITTWKTNGPNDDITIRINNNYTYDYTIDWGDGTILYNQATDLTHNYLLDDTYTVTISGTFPAIDTNADAEKLLNINQWGDIAWQSMKQAFYQCENMTSDATDTPDLRNVTDLMEMFSDAYLFNADISDWDVSNVIVMEGMFWGAFAFNQDISRWDVSSVESFGDMFNQAYAFNQGIGEWDVSSELYMGNMFREATVFNGDVVGWDVSSVTDMVEMFSYAFAFNQDIGGWVISSVTSIEGMFYGASVFNNDIGGWDVSSVTEMSSTFGEASAFNQDISGWVVNSVTNMVSMFDRASSFNQDISGWDVSSVKGMSEMFMGATAFNQDLSQWDVSSVTNMSEMFKNIALSTDNYDALLNGWSQRVVQPNVTFGAGDSLPSLDSDAAKATLEGKGWVITDGSP